METRVDPNERTSRRNSHPHVTGISTLQYCDDVLSDALRKSSLMIRVLENIQKLDKDILKLRGIRATTSGSDFQIIDIGLSDLERTREKLLEAIQENA